MNTSYCFSIKGSEEKQLQCISRLNKAQHSREKVKLFDPSAEHPQKLCHGVSVGCEGSATASGACFTRQRIIHQHFHNPSNNLPRNNVHNGKIMSGKQQHGLVSVD